MLQCLLTVFYPFDRNTFLLIGVFFTYCSDLSFLNCCIDLFHAVIFFPDLSLIFFFIVT